MWTPILLPLNRGERIYSEPSTSLNTCFIYITSLFFTFSRKEFCFALFFNLYYIRKIIGTGSQLLCIRVQMV